MKGDVPSVPPFWEGRHSARAYSEKVTNSVEPIGSPDCRTALSPKRIKPQRFSPFRLRVPRLKPRPPEARRSDTPTEQSDTPGTTRLCCWFFEVDLIMLDLTGSKTWQVFPSKKFLQPDNDCKSHGRKKEATSSRNQLYQGK